MEQSYEILAVDDDAAIVNILGNHPDPGGLSGPHRPGRGRSLPSGGNAEAPPYYHGRDDAPVQRPAGHCAHPAALQRAHPDALRPRRRARTGSWARPGRTTTWSSPSISRNAGPVKALLRRYDALGSIRETHTESRLQVGRHCPGPGHQAAAGPGGCGPGNAYGVQNSQMLLANPGHVFSSEEIYSRVWDREAYAVENTVMVHISRIREKLEVNPKKRGISESRLGIGYVLEAP